MQTVPISNYLYGSDTLSTFETSKVCRNPIITNFNLLPIPEDIMYAHEKLKGSRKVNPVLRSHNCDCPSVCVRNLVRVYIKTDKAKYGRCITTGPVPSIDLASGSLTVSGSNGHIITNTFQDTTHGIIDDQFAKVVLECIDCIDDQIDDLFGYGISILLLRTLTFKILHQLMMQILLV